MIHRRADGPVPIGPLIDQVLLRHRIPHTADMPRTKKADLAAKASRMLQLKDQAGELYRQADALLSELVSELGVGRSLALSEGVQFEIVDPFVDQHGQPTKHWRHVPVSRWDYRVTTPKSSGSLF